MGDKRGRLISIEDKREAIALIDEARRAGSRIKPACQLLGLDIRTLQRWQKEEDLHDKRRGPVTGPANKLTDIERAQIIAVANSAEYINQPPSQIVPNLADKNIYIGSEKTFYRVLKAEKMLQHRSSARPKVHKKPYEFKATTPNQLWSWDITYLMSNIRGKYFYLYLFMDVFSRKIVGFDVFERESAENAASVVTNAYLAEGLCAGEVVLHSDNGGPMKGSIMLATLQKLGIMPSFSRPSVSDDNPYSEALFKTLKYCPQYPAKPFVSVVEAHAWVVSFVHWYNEIHNHSGINFVTPNSKHQGLDKLILEKRALVYEQAKQLNPNRWSGQVRNWAAVEEVCLNKKHAAKKVA